MRSCVLMGCRHRGQKGLSRTITVSMQLRGTKETGQQQQTSCQHPTPALYVIFMLGSCDTPRKDQSASAPVLAKRSPTCCDGGHTSAVLGRRDVPLIRHMQTSIVCHCAWHVLYMSPLPPAEEVSTACDAGPLQWAQAHSTLLSTLITCKAYRASSGRVSQCTPIQSTVIHALMDGMQPVQPVASTTPW
jgi:hypothetical protein